jgi:hypothetical protein
MKSPPSMTAALKRHSAALLNHPVLVLTALILGTHHDVHDAAILLTTMSPVMMLWLAVEASQPEPA